MPRGASREGMVSDFACLSEGTLVISSVPRDGEFVIELTL